MLKDLSNDSKTILLLELTRRLIKYSSPTKYLKKIDPEASYKEAKESYNKQFKNYRPHQSSQQEQTALPPKPIKKKAPVKEPPKKKPLRKEDLEVPEPKLPPQYSHMEPNPKKIDLDLGKLNPLLNDPAVETIEVQGPDKKVRVHGEMGDMPTEIILNEKEISEIIQTIADKSNTAINIGENKVTLGKFEIKISNPEEGEQKITIDKSATRKNKLIGPNNKSPMPSK